MVELSKTCCNVPGVDVDVQSIGKKIKTKRIICSFNILLIKLPVHFL